MPRLLARLRILKKLPMLLDRIAALVASGKPLELWWQDEARFGQKTKITRRWAKRGSRPSAPLDQRTKSAWLFGAICPAEGKAAGLVLPKCDTAAMSLHLAEISQAVAPGAHAVVMLDQAGWHMSKKLKVPDNITLLPLPPKCPELNQPRISGNTCARTGFRTGFSAPTRISSITAATPGIHSQAAHG